RVSRQPTGSNDSSRYRLGTIADQEQSLTDAGDYDRTAREVRVVAPGARHLRSGAVRRGVEVTHLARIGRVGDVEDPEAGLVVGLIHPVALDVQVVVGGRSGADPLLDQHRVIQVLKVADQGGGSLACLTLTCSLVQLVAGLEVAMVVGEPALVGVGNRR